MTFQKKTWPFGRKKTTAEKKKATVTKKPAVKKVAETTEVFKIEIPKENLEMRIPNDNNVVGSFNIETELKEEVFTFTRKQLIKFSKFLKEKVYHRELSVKNIMEKIKDMCGFIE